MDYCVRWHKKRQDPKAKSSSLVGATLTEVGSLKLTLTTDPKEGHRNESHYEKVSHYLISPISHPFSVFSCQFLKNDGTGIDDNTAVLGDTNSHSSLTVYILLRPSGPFTQGLNKIFFPNGGANTPQEPASVSSLKLNCSVDGYVRGDEEQELVLVELTSDTLLKQRVGSRSLLSPHDIIVDSYYAGSFDWIDCAMSSHDDVNSRVPKTVRHGTSLHTIRPKLLIDSSPIQLKSIELITSRLEFYAPGRNIVM